MSLFICLLLLLAAFFAFPEADAIGTVQSTSAQGTLICNGKPSVGTKVKLYDHDTLDPDDLLDEGVTDEDGHFELSGSETEVTDIDPKVNVYHDCNDANVPCLLKFSIEIPQRLHHAGECGAEEEIRHWNHQPGGLILWPEPRLHQLITEEQAHFWRGRNCQKKVIKIFCVVLSFNLNFSLNI